MKHLLIKLAVIAALLALGVAGAYAQDDAAALYKSKCQVCHGPDGKGTPAGEKMGVKDFHSPEVAKLSDDELIKATKEGKGKMPKYEGKLTDDQIKSLVKYIRTLK
jgi:mono/diheme cytochrome c family protein